MKNEQVTYIARTFGRMGLASVQVGSTTIETLSPDEIEEVVGAGDPFKKGDVILKEGETYPHRVLAIQAPEGPGYGPGLLLRIVDEGFWAEQHRSPMSCLAWNDNLGWRNTYKKLSQEDLDAWFEQAKKPFTDGWHKLPATARFRVEAGIPVEIERRIDLNYSMRYLAEEVGRLTGYNLTMLNRYSDRMKRVMRVTQAVRRRPPRV
jgi:hypothetical protein